MTKKSSAKTEVPVTLKFKEQKDELLETKKDPYSMDIFLSKDIKELEAIASKHEVDLEGCSSRIDILGRLVKQITMRPNAEMEASGVIEIVNQGFGFLRHSQCNYVNSALDIYVSPNQIKKFKLKTGDFVEGVIRTPRDNENSSNFALQKVCKVNGHDDIESHMRIDFEDYVPIFPEEQFILENNTINDKGSLREKNKSKITTRLIDMVAPIGRGQRALIVAPPKAGKTEILKQIALSIEKRYIINQTDDAKKVHLLVLLIDERPEEVTEMQKLVMQSAEAEKNKEYIEVIASTFDQSPENHINVSQIVLEKARRLTEEGRNVVILMDSITRLARAYNNDSSSSSSGRTLSGGLDSSALFKPKQFFGSARNLQDGGSLTIIATCLIETGSKLDDVIYEEFKGTGNMELVLSRRLAQRRLFPAINIQASSTRRDDLILSEDVYETMNTLRLLIESEEDNREVLQNLIRMILKTKSNEEMFEEGKRDQSLVHEELIFKPRVNANYK